MLDILMLATEPFGTWGPGPVQSVPTRWEQTISHPTIISAFFGFFGGVLIKSAIDGVVDWRRRVRRTRRLAAELHSELRWIWEALRRVELNTIEERDRTTGETVVIYRNEWQRKPAPEMPVFKAQLGQLGLLGVEVSAGLIKLNGRIASWNYQVDVILEDAGTGNVTFSRDICSHWVNFLQSIRQDAADLNEPLAKAARTEVHDWEAVEGQIWRPPT
jgi:hypothetical protein